MISRQTIDTIFSAARVEEVIGDFVSLKRSGSNLKGLSPFADERTPSFMVSPAKQIWKDFSTGKGGNVVTFLMEHEQFNYPEALRWLAKRYNIEIETTGEQTEAQKEELKTRESLYIVSEFAKKYFIDQLHESEEGRNIGLSYFKERGFSDEIIRDFELGYSPKQRNALTSMAESKGYSPEILEAAGLSIYKEGMSGIDRFRERVMFPIQSFSGRTLGFGARILRNDIKAAKYLNSPETEIYQKSKILYGIFQSKQAILKENECLLVEGYTDVISLHQAGVKNVVSSSGTALTPEQIRLIKRLTPNVVLIFDGDEAGIRASFRGIDLILEQELNVKVLLLKDGDDPDTFAKKHTSEEIKAYIREHATDFIRFKSNVLLKEAQNDPVKKSELIRDIIHSISLIPNVIQRELYIQEAAKLMDVREEVMFKELDQTMRRAQNERKTSQGPSVRNATPLEVVKKEEVSIDQQAVIEEELIRLIMQYGDLIIELYDDKTQAKYETTVIEEILTHIPIQQLNNQIYQSIFEDVQLGIEAGELRAGDFFIKLFDQNKTEIASESMIEKYHLSDNWQKKMNIPIQTIESNIAKDITDTILRFKVIRLEREIKSLSSHLKDENISDEYRIKNMAKVMGYIKDRAELFKSLNRII